MQATPLRCSSSQSCLEADQPFPGTDGREDKHARRKERQGKSSRPKRSLTRIELGGCGCVCVLTSQVTWQVLYIAASVRIPRHEITLLERLPWFLHHGSWLLSHTSAGQASTLKLHHRTNRMYIPPHHHEIAFSLDHPKQAGIPTDIPFSSAIKRLNSKNIGDEPGIMQRRGRPADPIVLEQEAFPYRLLTLLQHPPPKVNTDNTPLQSRLCIRYLD